MTKYTAKYGWMAAKAAFYGLVFLMIYWITYALYNNGVHGVLNLCNVQDLNTWAIISAFMSWVTGGFLMFVGIAADACVAIKTWVVHFLDNLSRKLRRA